MLLSKLVLILMQGSLTSTNIWLLLPSLGSLFSRVSLQSLLWGMTESSPREFFLFNRVPFANSPTFKGKHKCIICSQSQMYTLMFNGLNILVISSYLLEPMKSPINVIKQWMGNIKCKTCMAIAGPAFHTWPVSEPSGGPSVLPVTLPTLLSILFLIRMSSFVLFSQTLFLVCSKLLRKSKYNREKANPIALYIRECIASIMHSTYFALINIVAEYDILKVYFLFPSKLERWRL